MNPRLTLKTCDTCGLIFMGGHTAKYCPTCRAERIRLHDRERHQRKIAGHIRHIGSTDLCAICGNEYTVNAGPQKYCPKCSITEAKRRCHELWLQEYYGNPSKRRKMIDRARDWAVRNKARTTEILRRSYESRIDEIKEKRRKMYGVKLRSLGRTDICPNCKNEFIVSERNQRYCSSCRKR